MVKLLGEIASYPCFFLFGALVGTKNHAKTRVDQSPMYNNVSSSIQYLVSDVIPKL